MQRVSVLLLGAVCVMAACKRNQPASPEPEAVGTVVETADAASPQAPAPAPDPRPAPTAEPVPQSPEPEPAPSAAPSPSSSAAAPLPSDVFAVADLAPKSGSIVTGQVRFTTLADATVDGTIIQIDARVAGAPPGEHGIHIHNVGDCSAADGSSAGDHLNPDARPHAGPRAALRHLGDLGNIHVAKDGTGHLTETLTFPMDTRGDIPSLMLGKSVIIDEHADDLTSQPSGNSGARIACGLINKAAPLAH